MRPHKHCVLTAPSIAARTPSSANKKAIRKMTEILKKGFRLVGPGRTKLGSDLKKKYDSGSSIRELAEETGRSYGFVYRLLGEVGVRFRGRGGAQRKKNTKPT